MKWAWISPVLWLAMVASLLWMRAMISVREWALPMPRWRSFPEWRRVGGCDSLVWPRCDGLIWPRVRLAGVLTV